LKTEVAPSAPGADTSGVAHLLVKRHQSHLSFSAFTGHVGEKITPGRAFYSQGLGIWLKWEPWKYVDAWAFGLNGPDGPVKLELDGARATPWEMGFSFRGRSVELNVEFYLLNLQRTGAAGCINLELDAPLGHSLTVEPLLDISPLHGEPRDDYWCRQERGAMLAGNGGATVCMGMPDNEISLKPRHLEWEYPMGNGERRHAAEGVVPVPVSRNLYSPGEISTTSATSTMLFSAAPTTDDALELLLEAGRYAKDREREERRVDAVSASLKLQDIPDSERSGVVARTVAMLKFGVLTPEGFLHEKGEFWDRRFCMGDALEGLYHNVGAYYRTGLERWLPEILLRAVRLRDDRGRLPSGFEAGGVPVYSGIWGTLFAPCLGRRLRDVEWPEDLNQELVKMLCSVLANEKQIETDGERTEEYTGCAWVGIDGLIRCAPHHGWAGEMRNLGGHLLPQRISLEWEEDLLSSGRWEQTLEPRYLLCEVNALWLCALKTSAEIARNAGDYVSAEFFDDTLSRAVEAYHPMFWDGDAGFVRHVVAELDGEPWQDSKPTSYGVQAAALLVSKDIFSDSELAEVLDESRKYLLVRRNGKAFGLRVTRSSTGLYLNRDQSLQGVCLPRLTPYIISLASRLNKSDYVAEFLASNLDHQMNEGCIFYNNDIFSTEGALDAVGNPAGWCSQWVDPYLAYLPAGREVEK